MAITVRIALPKSPQKRRAMPLQPSQVKSSCLSRNGPQPMNPGDSARKNQVCLLIPSNPNYDTPKSLTTTHTPAFQLSPCTVPSAGSNRSQKSIWQLSENLGAPCSGTYREARVQYSCPFPRCVGRKNSEMVLILSRI